jgi:hypothetical protein
MIPGAQLLVGWVHDSDWAPPSRILDIDIYLNDCSGVGLAALASPAQNFSCQPDKSPLQDHSFNSAQGGNSTTWEVNKKASLPPSQRIV